MEKHMRISLRRGCFVVVDFCHLALEPLDDAITELGNKRGIVLKKIVVAVDLGDVGEVIGHESDDGVHELVRAALVAEQEVLEYSVGVDGLHQPLLAQIVQQHNAILVGRAEQLIRQLVHHVVFHVSGVEEVDEGLQRCVVHVHLHHLRVHHVLHGCEHVLERHRLPHLVDL